MPRLKYLSKDRGKMNIDKKSREEIKEVHCLNCGKKNSCPIIYVDKHGKHIICAYCGSSSDI